MRLLEYEAKATFGKNGIPMPKGVVVKSRITALTVAGVKADAVLWGLGKPRKEML